MALASTVAQKVASDPPTMFPALESLLDFEGKTILINENTSDASFVYHHLISQHLKNNDNVVLIGTFQSFQHHCAIHAKHGTNLTDLKNCGRFIYIDGVKLCQDNTTEKTNCKIPDVKKMYYVIESELKSLDPSRRFLLVMEDVSTFLSFGVPVTHLGLFLHYCKTLVHPTARSTNCFVMLIHADINYDEDAVQLINYLTHQSQALVEVSDLATGYFAHVDGEIRIRNMERQEENERMHFKLDERNLKIFAAGTSPTIL